MVLNWNVIFNEMAVGFKLIEMAFILFCALIFVRKIREKDETRTQKEIYLNMLSIK